RYPGQPFPAPPGRGGGRPPSGPDPSMAPPGGSGAITLGVPLVDSKAPAPSGAFCRLVLQRKRSDCGIASPVIAALGGQNANRQSEQERGSDSDYAFGCHHGSPLGF